MIDLYLIVSGMSALSAFGLFIMKAIGCIKTGWPGVLVWIILPGLISWGLLSAAAQISAAV